MSRASERGPRGNARADRGRARERGRAPRRRARILEVVVWASVTIIARASNRFIVLHLVITRGIIPAPVNGSIRGRQAPPRAWVEVDLAAVVENARTVARVAGTRLLPVVKANAYGVGAVAVSKALEAVDPWGDGVATIEEGAELRAAGVARPVLGFMADRRDGSVDAQLERFKTAVGRLARRPALLHVANSAAALRGKAFALDAIRPGICLYGASVGEGLPIGKPVIALRARVVSVRTVQRGESVSYNASWTAPHHTTVATLGIGYADGVRRSLGLKAEATVLLNGARCPVVGLVTMDLTMVDVGDGRAAVGDVATLVGEADGLGNTLDQVAARSSCCN